METLVASSFIRVTLLITCTQPCTLFACFPSSHCRFVLVFISHFHLLKGRMGPEVCLHNSAAHLTPEGTVHITGALGCTFGTAITGDQVPQGDKGSPSYRVSFWPMTKCDLVTFSCTQELPAALGSCLTPCRRSKPCPCLLSPPCRARGAAALVLPP